MEHDHLLAPKIHAGNIGQTMPHKPNALLKKIARLIELNGPISLGDFMHIAMADPQLGYYKKRTSIGRTGDFITAPEISQMFGEFIAVWCISLWHQMGQPDPFCLAELGPGKGTLMKDLLRAARSDPAFSAAVKVVLVETSDRLQQAQRENLPPEWLQNEKTIWHTDIASLPEMPAIIIANEFLDVVPFRQYVKSSGKWHEIGISLAAENRLQKVALANTLDETLLPPNAASEPDGAIFEHAPAREAIIENLSTHLIRHQGAALFIDYGHLQSGFGDTFQAMAAHDYADPLEAPGEVDLTSHVDFDALANVARHAGIAAVQTQTQGEFLLELGLLQRAGALGAGKQVEIQDRIRSEVERLAGPDQMGTLFKVMAISTLKSGLPGFPETGN